MKYAIRHHLTYTYDRPVTLEPHVLGLRPRCDIAQTLQHFSLEINPPPEHLTDLIDLDGNDRVQLHFGTQPLDRLQITVCSTVETLRTNPFDFLLDPWASQLPFDYPAALAAQLQPYLGGAASNFPSLDPVAVTLSQQLWLEANGNPIPFLWNLNELIHSSCKYGVRDTGEPLPPGITWNERSGSCRDFAMLFMEVCRAVGLAARFVSGYQEGDPDWDERHLHAWVEVYLPGAGWRGYDPTQSLAVGDRYIALVAAPNSRAASPFSGQLKTGIGAQSDLTYTLSIEPLETSSPDG